MSARTTTYIMLAGLSMVLPFLAGQGCPGPGVDPAPSPVSSPTPAPEPVPEDEPVLLYHKLTSYWLFTFDSYDENEASLESAVNQTEYTAGAAEGWVVQSIQMEELLPGDTTTFRWVRPDGVIAGEDSGTWRDCQYMRLIASDYQLAASDPAGEWQGQFLLNDEILGSIEFTVIEEPQFTLINAKVEAAQFGVNPCRRWDSPQSCTSFTENDTDIVYLVLADTGTDFDRSQCTMTWTLPDGTVRNTTPVHSGGSPYTCLYDSLGSYGPTRYDKSAWLSGQYRVSFLHDNQEFDSRTFEYRANATPPPPDTIGTIHGVVRSAATGSPIGNATVLLDRSPEQPVSVTTDADGSYQIFVPTGLPDHFALSASASGYIPQVKDVQNALVANRTVAVDFSLQPAGLDTVVIEVAPEVHHLGNDQYDGTINSQFQKQAEGTTFSRVFTIAAMQLPPYFQTARVTLFAKGLQDDNEVRINGTLVGYANGSPYDGSYGEVTIPFSIADLWTGQNTISITSIDDGDGGGLDDFEFVNVQVRLTP